MAQKVMNWEGSLELERVGNEFFPDRCGVPFRPGHAWLTIPPLLSVLTPLTRYGLCPWLNFFKYELFMLVYAHVCINNRAPNISKNKHWKTKIFQKRFFWMVEFTSRRRWSIVRNDNATFKKRSKVLWLSLWRYISFKIELLIYYKLVFTFIC